jgi:hypothetical protein
MTASTTTVAATSGSYQCPLFSELSMGPDIVPLALNRGQWGCLSEIRDIDHPGAVASRGARERCADLALALAFGCGWALWIIP